MLLELRAENYAVIDRAVASFGPGLNLMTGETGAGKSILIDALEMLLGGKASSDVVRHGEEKAVVGVRLRDDAGGGGCARSQRDRFGRGPCSAAARDCSQRQGARLYQQPAGDGGCAATACAGACTGALAGRDAGCRSTRRNSGCCWTDSERLRRRQWPLRYEAWKATTAKLAELGGR